MTEQANVDHHIEAGMSLGRAIRWVDRTILRPYDPVVGWHAIFREARGKPGPRWHI